MNKSELFKAAHKLAKSAIKSGDNYRVTFGAAIKMILSESTVEIYEVEFFNAWTGKAFKKEIEALSHKDAIQKLEAIERKKATYVSKKTNGVNVEVIEDAENILFEMDMAKVDSVKFKCQRSTITITRAKVEAYLAHRDSIKRVSRIKALA